MFNYNKYYENNTFVPIIVIIIICKYSCIHIFMANYNIIINFISPSPSHLLKKLRLYLYILTKTLNLDNNIIDNEYIYHKNNHESLC